jgi:predicted GNAT superfamily acetyltransferase
MIRMYQASDFDAVMRVNAANVPEVGEMDAAKLELLLDEAGLVQVVEIDGEVHGLMFILVEGGSYGSANYAYFCERHPSFAYVDRIALADGARGKGWGPKLYESAEQWAKDNAKPFLVAEVNTVPNNPRSIRFHEIFGFTEVDRCNPYGPDEEVAMFEKVLA